MELTIKWKDIFPFMSYNLHRVPRALLENMLGKRADLFNFKKISAYVKVRSLRYLLPYVCTVHIYISNQIQFASKNCSCLNISRTLPKSLIFSFTHFQSRFGFVYVQNMQVMQGTRSHSHSYKYLLKFITSYSHWPTRTFTIQCPFYNFKRIGHNMWISNYYLK